MVGGMTMDELIECRECTSTHCKGCNIYILSRALQDGKFDSIMNANHCITVPDKIIPARHGKWELEVLDGPPGHRPVCIVCSECHTINCHATPYCPNCGAQM